MNKLQPRWHIATNELITMLQNYGIEFKTLNAIELFGREGDWHTKLFENKVKSMEVWEINPKYEKQLKNNLPNSRIKITDSIMSLKENEHFDTCDLILIDNPNNTFGPVKGDTNYGKYCEHFDILQNINKLIDKKALIIFNVNRNPFDYFKYPIWKERREKFYGRDNADDISIKGLFYFYEEFFKKMGFETIFHLNVPRVFYQGEDITHYFAFMLKRINKI